MATHDVMVIGGSAGAVEVLATLAAGLPTDLPASVFIVVHFPEHAESLLPAILNRKGRVPAAHAGDGEPIRLGRIYVAPPGRQMLFRDGRIALHRGPSENGFRPAIDSLFRSAAAAFGPRVIGVVISGTLDDGTVGLAEVKRAGGLTIVQDRDDARAPGMPQSASAEVQVDYTATADELAPLLARLAPTDAPVSAHTVSSGTILSGERVLHARTVADGPRGQPTTITCPDCHGVLNETHEAGVMRFQCQVGHVYSAESADAAQSDATERALWAAVRALRERMVLTRRMAERSRRMGQNIVAERFELRASRLEEDVAALGQLVTNGGEDQAERLG